jgi:hypothetical protein
MGWGSCCCNIHGAVSASDLYPVVNDTDLHAEGEYTAAAGYVYAEAEHTAAAVYDLAVRPHDVHHPALT